MWGNKGVNACLSPAMARLQWWALIGWKSKHSREVERRWLGGWVNFDPWIGTQAQKGLTHRRVSYYNSSQFKICTRKWKGKRTQGGHCAPCPSSRLCACVCFLIRSRFQSFRSFVAITQTHAPTLSFWPPTPLGHWLPDWHFHFFHLSCPPSRLTLYSPPSVPLSFSSLSFSLIRHFFVSRSFFADYKSAFASSSLLLRPQDSFPSLNPALLLLRRLQS